MGEQSNIKPFWMEGNFGPVGKEVTSETLKVTGEIPKDLNGRYFRNGANPRVTTSSDWFLGEGMIHGVRIQDGKALWYKNRYIQTPLLKEDVITRELTSIPGNSLANTHVVAHADKVFALQEMHGPIELTKDMETVGPYNFDGKLGRNMTAHPKICPKTGEMLFFGYGVMPPFLTYYRVSAEGEMVQSEIIDVKAATMVHDFVVTENYVIFLDLPMLWDMKKFLQPGIPVSYDESYGARLGVMPRDGKSDDVRWIEIDPCYIYHTMNAYEYLDEIIFIAPKLVGYTSVGMANPPIPKLNQWTINLKTGKVKETQLDDVGVDFPEVPPSLVGQPFRYGYTAEFETSGSPWILGYHKYDLVSGERTAHMLENGRTGSEASFIPSENATAEDDGYLMSFVYDPEYDKSELVIFNAKEFGDEPLCRIHLPARVPAGFHGSWISDS
ncbi:MAG: carotenoid oxygenase family protein [Maricaulaceae bacterium]